MFKKLIARIKAAYNWLFETELLRRILANSGYLVSATGFTAALGMVQGIFVARMLGPAGLGLWGAVKQFTNVSNRFASFRIHEMVVRYVRLYEEKQEQEKAAAVFKIAALFEFFSSLLAFALIWWLAPLAVEYLVDNPADDMKFWFVLYGMVVLFNFSYDASTGLLQVFNRFRAQAILTSVQGVFQITFILIAYLSDSGFTGVLIAFLAGKLIGSIGIMFLAVQTAVQQWGTQWFSAPIRSLTEDRGKIFKFAFSTNLSGTISLVAKDSESLWVNAFLGNVVGGYYELARSLVGILQIPVAPLPSTTYPELSREVAQKNWKNTAYVLQRGTILATAYSFPVTLGLLVFGPLMIELMYGEAFLPAYPALMILMFGYLFVNVFFWNRVALLALDRPVFPTIVNFIGMVIKVTGIFILVPRYGYLQFAALLSGYYIFTVGLAALRVVLDVQRNLNPPEAVA